MGIDPGTQTGALPEAARRRLDDLKQRSEGGHRLATTDFSVDEFLLVQSPGFEPVGMVVGSSVYHMGYQRGSCNQNMYTQALYEERELAMTRMQAEAERMNATTVVETRLEVATHIREYHVMEFLSIGTAVRPITGDVKPGTPQLVLGVDR
jgi:uncharacterized protein YbjQ (UPF0145 family)